MDGRNADGTWCNCGPGRFADDEFELARTGEWVHHRGDVPHLISGEPVAPSAIGTPLMGSVSQDPGDPGAEEEDPSSG